MDNDERIFTIKDDGVYEAPDGSRFQFRKGHVLGAEGADLKRVGDFVSTDDDRKAVAKAETAPENKAAAKPENKSA